MILLSKPTITLFDVSDKMLLLNLRAATARFRVAKRATRVIPTTEMGVYVAV